MEEWKDIKEYNGLYQISDLGRIKSLKRTTNTKNGIRTVNEKILSQKTNSKWGYCEISLHKNGKSRTFRVNRLVAINFINNPNNYNQVNHKDGNKLNNNKTNLEWCNNSMNQIHAHTIGLKRHLVGENSNRSNLKESTVLELREKYNNGTRVKDLCKEYNIKYITCWFIVKERNYKIEQNKKK